MIRKQTAAKLEPRRKVARDNRTTIQVRNIPGPVKLALTRKAAALGISLGDYILDKPKVTA